MSELIGVNSRGKDPQIPQQKFNHIREYHSWSVFAGFDTDLEANEASKPIKLQPAYDFSLNFDDYYAGVSGQAMPVIQSNAPEHRGINGQPSNYSAATNLKPYFHPNFAASTPIVDSFPTEVFGDHDNDPCSDEIWYPVFTTRSLLWRGNNSTEFVFGKPYRNEIPVDPCDPNSSIRTSLNHENFWRRVLERAFTVTDDTWQQTPQSYAAHAEAMTLHAIRYGSNSYSISHPFGDLYSQRSDNDDPFVLGQGSVTWFENQNEPDRWWRDTKSLLETPSAIWQSLPEYMAAMSSADYDGHGGAIKVSGTQTSLGIKSVDPALKLALPGLSNFRTGYTVDMLDWFVSNRAPGQHDFQDGPQLPFDAFNFHHYANVTNPNIEAEWLPNVANQITTGTDINTLGPDARSPEREELKQQLEWSMREVTRGAARLGVDKGEYSSKEFFISEFGYDSESDTDGAGSSPYDVPGSNVRERWLYHGQWYVRSFLEISAAHYTPVEDADYYADAPGVLDRSYGQIDEPFEFTQAHAYELKDDPGRGTGTGQFQTSGLLYQTPDDQYTPKTAWYFVQGLRNVIGNYTFVKELDVSYSVGNGVPNGLDLRAYLYEDEVNFPNNTMRGRYRIAWWLAGENLDEYEITNVLISDPDGSGVFSGIFGDFTAGAFELSTRSEIPQRRSYPGSLTITPNAWEYSELPVSETPRFLIPETVTEPSYPSVTGINVKDACCGGVRVTWSNSGTVTGYTFNVYAVPVNSVNGDPNNFDVADPLTVQVATGISGRSAFVSRLTPGVEYYFFVIPVTSSNGQLPNFSGSASYEDYASDVFEVGDCNSSCFIPVNNAMVSGSSGASTQQGIGILNTFNSFNTCGSLNEDAADATIWTAVGWVTVDFGDPQLINAIYLFDANGIGDLIIEGKYCDCSSDWTPVTSYRTAEYNSWAEIGSIGEWSQIRLRKGDGANIGLVRFCGEPGVLNCEGSPYPFVSVAFPEFPKPAPVKPQVVTHTKSAAVVEWNFGLLDTVATYLGVSRRYNLSVSEIVGEVEIPIDENLPMVFSPTALTATYRLESLDPQKKYKVTVETVDSRPDPNCSYAGTGVSGTVIISPISPPDGTGGGDNGRQSSNGTPTANDHIAYQEWSIAPNPASELVRLTFPEGTSAIVVFNVNGVEVARKQTNSDQLSDELDLRELPPGMYAVGIQHRRGFAKKWLFVGR
ncbi:MAG: T9SS type A sorting domain-containing protein [Saprospiraceae bacterium]